MSDLEHRLREHLGATARPPARRPNWDDVLARAGGRRRGRPALALTLALLALALGATALAKTLGDGFSDWLTGKPGQPAPADEQERFRAANRRSAAPFPAETELRELIRTSFAGRTYRLMGFRTGAAVCLRLVGETPEGSQMACVAADELERSRDLAVPLVVDAGLAAAIPGREKRGQATFGLAAGEARSVRLIADDGVHEAIVENGAFLYLGPGPGRERTTVGAVAIDRRGREERVPLATSLTDENPSFETGLKPHGPASPESVVRGGRIRWFEQREERGEQLDPRLRDALSPDPIGDFARVIRPDPADFLAVLVAERPGAPDEICVGMVTRGGIGKSCVPPQRLFSRGPVAVGWTYMGVGRQFVIVSGIASDDVARLRLFLGTEEAWDVPLRNNVFVARVQRAKFPARLVAYDLAGRVIGVETNRGF